MDLLAAYDAQLRAEAELGGAVHVATHGPLFWATFHGGRGFVTYRDLAGSGDLEALVTATKQHFSRHRSVVEVEWKARGHDLTPGLEAILARQGFVAGDVESVMIGETAGVPRLPPPEGVRLRQVRAYADVEAVARLHSQVFADPYPLDQRVGSLMRQLRENEGLEIWAAEADGLVVSAGRLEPVPGTDFAGLWGGATLPEWRGRGIYRALVARRADASARAGKRWLHSDSTPFSRPILERCGFHRVTTTIPWTWHP
ncbi:GNAT family N-acetyltransferase [Parenemella sanctibonifatiensis]|uniref:GNAT family N-acetyltransferase n=1 Tax=Parenemella sanctibonifatiensis TaxID=2016505 RepID=UPI001E2B4833|nr:GNAT family N-acetyltransferase [Parenemella sanctibonifatiensis]